MIKKILFILIISQNSFSEEFFPVDENLQKRVDFWKKIYTEVSTNEGFLHDEDDLTIIFEKIDLKGLSDKAKSKKIKAERKRWGEIIESIYKKNYISLSPEERKIYERIKRFPHRKLKAMAREIRFQSGLSDRYYHGLQESYKYLDEIKDEFKKLGLPVELAFLPHVESSFNYKAYSKVGAAGIWQFMGSTARLYKLKKNYLIDERRDPLLSTQAASKLLRDNYKRFKSWPLAITSYNSGPNSLARAIIKTGSRNLSQILESYDGGNFGFASKNFYATFIAASEISKNPQAYFKKIQKRSHPPFEIIKVPKETKISQLAKTYKLALDDLENYNLALRPVVFKRNMSIPKGFLLKIPQGIVANKNIEKVKVGSMATANEDKNFFKFRVEPDETLGHYADWSLVPKEKILALNKMLKKNIIVGSEVRLPINNRNQKRFLRVRADYHKKIQERFFNKFKIESISQYEIKKGDTLEKLTGKLELPLWLIKKYQKNLKFQKLKVGDTLEIPKIVSVSDSYRFPLAPNQ